MGCNVSRFEANRGAAFLKGLQTRRRLAGHPSKDSTLYKKELLSHDQDMKLYISSNPSNGKPRCSLEDIMAKSDPPNGIHRTEIEIESAPLQGVGIAIIIADNNYGIMKVVADENSAVIDDMKESPIAVVKTMKEEDDDDERMIGFSRSPSFRIYFKENLEESHNQIAGKNDQTLAETVSTGDHHIVPPKELSYDLKKKVKREKRKRCFRKVLPKRGEAAAVKNVLNMKSCSS